MQENLPRIAIVGRPNVGKSSIFNKIIGKQKSIIHNKPGVTRDRNYYNTSHNSYNFLITDTGGIEKENTKNINKNIKNIYIKNNNSKLIQNYIKEQVLIAINEATLILFIIEAQQILPDDHSIAAILRKANKQIILVVNKTDNDAMKNIDAYQFGFTNVIFTSAAHGRNILPLLNLITQYIPQIPIQKQNNKTINVAIIGRPNSGKSSLLNKIIGKNRSIVSNIPGTTRDTITETKSINNTIFNFIDTAGMRKKSKVNDNVEYYSVNRAIKSMNESNITVHLIDAQENIAEQDKKIIAIATQKGNAIIIAINKWDLIQKYTNFKEYADKLRFKFAIGQYIPVINISALNGNGINKLIKMIINIYKQYQKRIDTTTLNKTINNAQKKYNVSGKKGALKIYYATQIKTAPPRFIVFVNKKELLTKNYTNYLVNTLRNTFNFTGIPLFIHPKKSN